VDGVLVEWGERLLYPANRVVRPDAAPRMGAALQRRAAAIRQRIQTTVSRRSVQVMVKVTGGGRGMGAIAAHFRYISKAGRLDIEDDRGEVRRGKEALHDLVEQWRYGGLPIDEVGHRREAFNIMLSMPRGTDAQVVLMAAREFARDELRGHRYVMVLHDHQANPHTHLSVRAASTTGERLNPRKADLHRWRETFAEKLRGYGIEAEATRQATRGVMRNVDPLWRLKASDEGRLHKKKAENKSGAAMRLSRQEALIA
jgi:mRNA-degrading endonuclease toxin of MazEF toxin-antitoxin module